MMPRYLLSLSLLAAAPVFAESPQRVEHSFPAFFIPNAGQSDPAVRFLVRTPSLNAAFGADGAVFELGALALRVAFEGANPTVKIEGESRLDGTANFLTGDQPQRWKANLPTYQKIRGFWS